MRDTPGSGRADPLLAEARRYAGGDRSTAATAAFERRLATDQEAREALCDAVRVTWAAGGEAALSPDPAYRAEVVRRLLGRRAYGAHPLVWAGLGAAAALLLALGALGRMPPASGPAPAPAAATPGLVPSGPTVPKVGRPCEGRRHGGHMARCCRGEGGPCRHRVGRCPGRRDDGRRRAETN
jgi:hypothetical protein